MLRRLSLVVLIAFFAAATQVRAQPLFLSCTLDGPSNQTFQYSFEFNSAKKSLLWEEANQELRVVRNTASHLWASHQAKFRDFPHDTTYFRLNRVTGTAEVIYLQKPNPAEVARCKALRSWGCEDSIVLTQFSESGRCAPVDRANNTVALTYAGQEVGGLKINYSPSFKKEPATADSWLSQLPETIRQVVISMDSFVAPPSNGLGQVRLVKVRYMSTVNVSIDGAAAESSQRIAALEGIKNFQKKIMPLSVSGFDARQVSIAADRMGGKLGVEVLFIYNRKTNVMWQMQLIFEKNKGINPFESLNIDEERHYAKDLLSTIVINP